MNPADSHNFKEDADVRVVSATRKVDDSYANGYGNSKWGGEVLLREANEHYGLPVSVFRCDMILADTTYAGQLNLPDMFTRMMLSLVATGVAPYSFYELDAGGNRQRAHYDGLPVEFIAEAISTIGANVVEGFETFHVMNPYDDGIGRVRRLAGRCGLPDPPHRLVRRLVGTVRHHAPGPAREATCRVAAAAAAQLPVTGTPDQRVDGADGPVPFGRAGREDRSGQGHSAHLRAGDRQVHHRPGAARPALNP
jgi:nucleoside-diphosphate-sugar epimerase